MNCSFYSPFSPLFSMSSKIAAVDLTSRLLIDFRCWDHKVINFATPWQWTEFLRKKVVSPLIKAPQKQAPYLWQIEHKWVTRGGPVEKSTCRPSWCWPLIKNSSSKSRSLQETRQLTLWVQNRSGLPFNTNWQEKGIGPRWEWSARRFIRYFYYTISRAKGRRRRAKAGSSHKTSWWKNECN